MMLAFVAGAPLLFYGPPAVATKPPWACRACRGQPGRACRAQRGVPAEQCQVGPATPTYL